MQAAAVGRESIAALLVDAKATLDVQNIAGVSALIKAASKGHVKTVQLLVERKADVNLRTHTGHTALTLAAIRRHAAVVELLVQADRAEVNAQMKVNCPCAVRVFMHSAVSLPLHHTEFAPCMDAERRRCTAFGRFKWSLRHVPPPR